MQYYSVNDQVCDYVGFSAGGDQHLQSWYAVPGQKIVFN